MQGAQTESRFRGIGRYSLSLALAIARAPGNHEVVLALNGLLPESIKSIRDAFSELLPRENVRIWNALGPTRELEASNATRRAIAERTREAFLLSLNPDVVLITSLFEGLGDDAVVSLGTLKSRIPTAIILYDLIPLINPDIHFRSSSLRQDYYARKIEYLRNADHLLAISDSARNEALGALGFDERRITSISGACDISFKQVSLTAEEREKVHRKFGITDQFLLYTGGADERKNLVRLVSAYAALPPIVRKHHQLIMAGHMPPTEVEALQSHGSRSGLAAHALLFTGYVSDSELLVLYNSCKLFVFPSTHEGFGIPPLEAMSCGAAVIGANSTSLPEVIGLAEAMFDPESVDSIHDKILQGLTDEGFRTRLLENGRIQSRAFSWDHSASAALRALGRFDARAARTGVSLARLEQTTVFTSRPKKILLLKLDHLGDFILAMPAISKLKKRYPASSLEIAIGSWNVALAEMFPYFDKIHVLDFFKKKSSGQATIEADYLQEFFAGLDVYDLAIDLRRPADTRFILKGVRAQSKVGYQTFDPVADQGLDIAVSSEPDLPFVETSLNRTSISRQMVALIDALPQEADDFISIPSLFEHVERKKGSIALFPYAGNDVKEWHITRYQALVVRLCEEDDVQEINIYFGSEAEASRHAFDSSVKVRLHAALSIPALMESLAASEVCIANNSGGAHLASCLGLTTIGVYGGHETAAEWAPVFSKSYVIHRNAECSPCHIAQRSDCKYQFFCLDDIKVDDVHGAVMDAVRGLDLKVSLPLQTPKALMHELLAALAPLTKQLTDAEVAEVARCVTANIRPKGVGSRLFVDISELVQRDSRTGIQRVTRSILKDLLENPPQDYEIVPVYATSQTQGYFVASSFLQSFSPASKLSTRTDDMIDFYAGDTFLGLDLQPHIVPAQRRAIDDMHRNGVKVLFVVYDLLCVQMPQYFVEGSARAFSGWLDTVARYDGALCISKAVADDTSAYMRDHHPEHAASFYVGWFHIAADIASSSPTRGLPFDAPRVLETLKKRPTFLNVGTMEPRKGHAQTLDGFDQLWSQGFDVNLVIVGKQGWLMDVHAARMRSHPEAGKRLLWLEHSSDEYLEAIYGASTCLLAPSEGEGFGLPLIEAARHKLPVIARDLPVFREVAGAHAFYFQGLTSDAIAKAVQTWLTLFRQQAEPKSEGMSWRTWRQTTQDVLALVRRIDIGKIPPTH